MEREWAENKLADFTLWASGIGAAADASDKISLDARLAGKPGLIQIFTHLLQMLARFLVECQTLSLSGPDERGRHQDRSPCRSAHSNSGLHQSRESQRQGNRSRSISPWSDQSSVTSEPDVHVESGDNGLAEARRGVDSTLDQLNNLSIAVRRTGNQLRLRKADARFDRSEHANLEAFLRVWVLAHTTMDALNVMQDADRLTPIQKRLIEVNLRRRNRFLYAQQHSKKMAYKIVAREPQKTMELAPASTSSALPKYEDENPKLPSWTPKRAEAQEKHLAETWVILADNSTATRFGATTDIFKERLLPQNSQITTTAARVSYPDPPKLDPDTQFFKCPCCCQTPSRTLVRGNLWR